LGDATEAPESAESGAQLFLSHESRVQHGVGGGKRVALSTYTPRSTRRR
jgi:hypothetical protein